MPSEIPRPKFDKRVAGWVMELFGLRKGFELKGRIVNGIPYYYRNGEDFYYKLKYDANAMLSLKPKASFVFAKQEDVDGFYEVINKVKKKPATSEGSG